ncbi:hypothetical protein CF326_g3312 [Tilletia indica]|nr:hypothetical protein CF326_g3312 [Tilletia indica]
MPAQWNPSANPSPSNSVFSLSATDDTPSLVSPSQDSRPSSDDESEDSSSAIITGSTLWQNEEQQRERQGTSRELAHQQEERSVTTTTFYHPSETSIAAVALASRNTPPSNGTQAQPSSSTLTWPAPPLFPPVSVQPASLQRWIESQNRHHRRFTAPAPPYSHSPSPSYSELPSSPSSTSGYGQSEASVSLPAPVHPSLGPGSASRAFPAELVRPGHTRPEDPQIHDESNPPSSLSAPPSQAPNWSLLSSWLRIFTLLRPSRRDVPRPDEERPSPPAQTELTKEEQEEQEKRCWGCTKDPTDHQNYEKGSSAVALPPSYENAIAGPSSNSVNASMEVVQSWRQRTQYVRLAWACFILIWILLTLLLILTLTHFRR